MVYEQVTKEQRFKIQSWLETDMGLTEIANRLNKGLCSITREITRNSYNDGRYDAGHADNLCKRRRKAGRRSTKKLIQNDLLLRAVKKKLKRHWSPEQIAGRRKKDGLTYVSAETIYQYIYIENPALRTFLRQKKGKYRRRNGTAKREKEREFAKKTWITDRPAHIDICAEIGHWEGDTIKGRVTTKAALVTHVERFSGYALSDKVDRATTELVNKATTELFRSIPKKLKITETLDNGTEFNRHEELEKKTGIRIFFALPYHSWERPCNENFNGLMRQYFPKKTDFATVSRKEVASAVKELNHRPRKRLGFLTPYEVFVKGFTPFLTCTSN